jgi:DNA (cytosine-5)-methyltransferase 1
MAGGGISPTITGDHQNRITDYTAIALTERSETMETVVRRLTPLECERLQGFPDDWTNIGDWVDSKGKKHKEADSPRYRALGNSLALPFWDWLAGRMCEHFDYQPTMASLFDGISGFPLVFERHGAKAIWASEVDEFAIAVAKRHFPEGGEENAETAENL